MNASMTQISDGWAYHAGLIQSRLHVTHTSSVHRILRTGLLPGISTGYKREE